MATLGKFMVAVILGLSLPRLVLAADNASSVPAVPTESPTSGSQAGNQDAVPAGSLQADAASKEAVTPASKPSSNRFIEEIVVTAQKREENLQNVPITVQAFSADRLDAVGVSNIKDLPLLTPGLTVTETSGFTLIYIRGVGSDTFLMGDPNVATYLDGVYLPFAAGAAQELSGLERIEVLKGPQGTLFGRGANGGAVNILTKNPTFEPKAEVEESYDSFNTLSTKIYLNGPLTDSVAFNVSAFHTIGDHYYNKDSRAGGQPLPQISAEAARAKLLWKPTENSDVIFSVLSSTNQGTGSGLQGNSAPSLLGQLLGIKPQTGYTVINDTPDFLHATNLIYSATASLKTDWFDLKALGSRQDGKLGLDIDFDGSPVPIASFGTNAGINHVSTGEFQIVSNEGSPGASWLKYNGGVYYVNWYSALDPVYLSLAGIDLSTGAANSTISLPPGFVQALDALLQPLVGFGVPSGKVRLVGATSLLSKAIYAQSTATITDWLSLTLGARYQNETRKLNESSAGLGDSFDNPVLYIQRYHGEKKGTYSFKPKVTIEVRPFADTDFMAYASFQQAIKGPQYNVINIYTPPPLVKAETMDAFEVGIKSRPFGLGTFNASLFQYNIKNLQVQFVSLLQGGAVTQQNAGGARIQGADFDLLEPLLPNLIDGLVMTVNGTFLHAIYTSYTNADGFSPSTGLLTSNNDYSGNPITRTPKFSGTLGLSKSTEVPGGTLEVTADLYHTDSFFYLAEALPDDKGPAYTLVNSRISYLYQPWDLRVAIFGRNLTDKQYDYGRFHVDFGTADYLGPPRSFGLQVQWKF